MKRILFLGLACCLLSLGGGCCLISELCESPVRPHNRGSFEHCGYGCGRGYGYSSCDGPNYGINCGPNCGPRAAASCGADCAGGVEGCESCAPACDEGCGPPVHHHCGPLSWVFYLLKREVWCGKECIDRRRGYWGEIDQCDPCDQCGNFTGGGDCGCSGGPSSYRTHGAYRAEPGAEVYSEEVDEVGSRPQRPTPAVRNGEPRRAAQPQRAYSR